MLLASLARRSKRGLSLRASPGRRSRQINVTHLPPANPTAAN
jgi:hypothetical protein